MTGGPDKLFRESPCDVLRHHGLTYLNGGISSDERSDLEHHIRSCPLCSEQTAAIRQLRHSLKSTSVPTAPADLNTRLRVVASREKLRHQRRSAGLWKAWQADIRLFVNNLMRPFVIPTAGGFVAALLLFGVLAASPSMRVVSANSAVDVPTMLYTEASVYSYLPIDFEEEDLVVELTVDEQGHMLDYEIPGHQTASPALRKNIEKHLLTMQFNPARSFGQATHGRVRIWFRSSRIDVKG
jgi:hypothetical protein